MIINKTEKFKLRKSKKYKNLVSVGLGVMTAVAIGVASDNEAYASDQTVGNATNSATTQPPANKVQNDNLANTNTSTGAVNINIDNSNVKNAVNRAKNEGVNVVEKTQDLGVTTNAEETRRKRNEAIEQNKVEENKINEVVNNYKKEKEANQNAINTATSENREKQAQYEKNLANYNKEKAEIENFNNNTRAENERKTEDYNKKLLEYEKLKEEQKRKLEELKNNSGKDGYLSDSQLQSLVYQNEPDAHLEINAGENKNIVKDDNIQLTSVYSASGYYIEYNDYKPIYLTYTNLKNSTYGDSKISKVVYKIQRKTRGNHNMSLSVFNDPTTGIGFNSKDPRQELGVEITFYDENDNQIRFNKENPGLLAISSITTNAIPDGSFYREVIKDYNFSFVKITGSSVTEQADGIYSIKDNKFKGQGAKYEHTETDFEGSPLYWYLGAAGKLDNADSIKMTFLSDVATHSQFWMSINSRVASPVAVYNKPPKAPILEELKTEPPKPEKPTPTPIPAEVTAPTVGYTTFRLAERPRVFKEARNLDNTNLDNSLVSKNSTVKFTLKVDKLPAGREVLNVLEFTDHLPQGYVIDEATVTRENNALGYNTVYDKANHTVVFSANSTLLNKLNENLNEVIDVVAPTVTGTVTNDGGIYKNNFKINLNNTYTTHSNVVTVNTPNGITPNKTNTNADNSNIDGKIVVAETTNYYKLTWDLDQYRGMKLSKNDIAKGFYYVEDYPEEAVTINNRLVSLVDSNGTGVQGVEITNYDSLENAPENVKTMLSKANITPKGAFQLFTATNPTDFYNKYVVTGNSIKITNPMVVKDSLTQTGGVYENKAYQIDLGNGYATGTVRNIVPKVDTNKHNYNEDGVLIDGKQVVAGTTNHYKLTWDLDQYRGMSATNSEIASGFFFVEDYPEEALTIDNTKVTMLDSNGQAVTGVEVSSYNSLENAPEEIKKTLVNAKITPKGAFQLFRATNAKDFFNKYVLTGNSITITTPMKVKEELTTTGGTYNNKAYQVDFGKAFETNIVTNIVPKVTPEKHNTNEDGVVVDGKQIVAGTTNYYKLTWDLTPYRGVVPTRNELNKGFFFVEDYPEKEVTIDNSKVTMVDSKGQAVTGVEVSSYNSLEEAPENVRTMLSKANISPKGAFQLFNASSPENFFNKYASVGNSITITTPMTVKEELTRTGGTIRNKGYQVDFGKGRETEIITNEIPKVTPEKHNTNEDGTVVDGKQIVAGTTNYYKLTWDLTPYRGVVPTRNELNKGFFFVEDYPEKEVTIDNTKVTMVDSKGQAVTGVEVSSYNSLEEAPENVKTMLSKANISPKGAFQLFNASSPVDFFNKYASVGNSITITTPMKVKEELTTTGGTIRNKGYQIDFGKGRETEIITNEIPKVTPEKHNTNEDGVVVDGKQVVAGTTNHYKLTWDLDQYRDMTATSREVARGFFVVEDYPEEALTIDNSKVTMVDSKGQAVTGVEVLSYDSVENAPDDIKKALVNAKITPKGAFQLFRATNSRDFFNKYVLTGNSITITTPMKVKEELTTTGGVFNNKMYQVDFGKGREVEHEVTNNIPKVEPTKHNTNEDGVVVDGNVIAPETVNNYKLLWDLDQYKGVVATSRELAKGFYFVEDYPEEALAINNSKVTMVDSKGQAVTGVEVLSYNSVENAPEDIKKALANAKITPKGAFQVYKATNSREFYDKYVFTGNSITITSPMTMLDSVNKNGAVYNNKAYQIDFGKGRETDVVTNTVPKSNPEKHNYNEDGVLIDGGLVPVGSTTEYKLTWKLSNLRDVVGTNEAINRGFYYIDDYPEVLKTLDDRIKVLDSNGNVVNGIRVTKYDNLEQASSEIKAILSKNNITPKGAFQVFSAENPIEFYNNYVKKGIDLTIVNPMQVTQALKENGGSYQNVAYEIDFGVAQVTDTITNTVPKVKPVKHNYNEDNVKIDGKVVLAASRTNYKLNWNLSAYKNIEASDKYIKKGFYFVDDYPEEALSLDEKNITITDDKGKAVAGVEVVNYESLEKAPEEVKAVLKEAKVTPKGAFQLFKATDPKQFYNDYVKTGTNLTITNPMTVKPELARKDSKKLVDNNSKETENKTVNVTKVNNSVTTTNTKPEVDKAINEAVEKENNILNTISKVSTEKEKGKVTEGTEKTTEYKNRGYQIDFGNGYETDVVANNVPKIDPIKDVVIDVKGKESLQGKEIKLNKLFNYKLIGTEIPSNRGTKLTQYGFSDDYDEKADKYQANYRVFSMKDIKLTDGSIIKQDSELTKYTTQIMTDGKVDIEFDKEFLDKVDLDSEFQAEVYLQMERIASGEVKNTFIHTVNGVEETSNTVTTFTKEPEKPVEPVKPEEPKQSVPPKVEEKTPNKSTGKVLPNTGVADNDGTSTAIALTALATAGFIARRKKVKNS